MPRNAAYTHCDRRTFLRTCFISGSFCLGLAVYYSYKNDLTLYASPGKRQQYEVSSTAPSSVTITTTKSQLGSVSPIWFGSNLDVLNLTKDGRPSGLIKYFYPIMTKAERLELNKQIRMFMDIAEKANLTYMMCFGTLLGSYRHHGMIPWDDDFDVIMDWSQEADVRRALDLYLPGEYKVFFQQTHWKLYNKEWPVIREELPWRFPYIDILFFRESDGVLYGQRDAGAFKCNRSDVFPVKWRPYWDMQMPVPRNYIQMVHTMYGDMCKSRPYSHKEEHPIGSKKIGCDVLKEFYPFVSHERIDNIYVNETLYLNSTIIHSITSVA